MPETLEAIYCPGWTFVQSGTNKVHHMHCGGGRRGAANLLTKSVHSRIEVDPVTHVRNHIAIDPPIYPDMCPRCEKQKKKWDEDHGALDRQAAERAAAERARLDRYAADLDGVGLGLKSLIPAIEGLSYRSTAAPFDTLDEAKARLAEENKSKELRDVRYLDDWQWRNFTGQRDGVLNFSERWTLLRILADLEPAP